MTITCPVEASSGQSRYPRMRKVLLHCLSDLMLLLVLLLQVPVTDMTVTAVVKVWISLATLTRGLPIIWQKEQSWLWFKTQGYV